MALCPICRTPAPWWKVFFLLNRWNFINCKTCGTPLRPNNIRVLLLLLFFSVPILTVVYMRNLGILTRNDIIPFIVFLMVLLPFAWVHFTKLEIPFNLDTQEQYRSAAERGDVNAQFSLGFMYATGQGTKQDYQQALHWYLKAAEQGDADAQNNLGVMYRLGQGIQQDIQQAALWYRKAAEQGHSDAENSLGFMYQNGLGVQLDYLEAAKWYQQSAEHGFALGQYNLGRMYALGQGVQRDCQQAIFWMSKSAEQGYEDAIKGLKILPSEFVSSSWPDRIPGETSADFELQLDIVRTIAFQEGFEGGNPGCRVLNTRRLIASTELIPQQSRDHLNRICGIAAAKCGRKETGWSREEWTIDRKGKKIYYEIILIQSPVEGTDIITGRVQETPFLS